MFFGDSYHHYSVRIYSSYANQLWAASPWSGRLTDIYSWDDSNSLMIIFGDRLGSSGNTSACCPQKEMHEQWISFFPIEVISVSGSFVRLSLIPASLYRLRILLLKERPAHNIPKIKALHKKMHYIWIMHAGRFLSMIYKSLSINTVSLLWNSCTLYWDVYDHVPTCGEFPRTIPR